MNKQEAISYINNKCNETNGIAVFDLEHVMSRENAASLGIFKNEDMLQILYDTADCIMSNSPILNKMDDLLKSKIDEAIASMVPNLNDDQTVAAWNRFIREDETADRIRRYVGNDYMQIQENTLDAISKAWGGDLKRFAQNVKDTAAYKGTPFYSLTDRWFILDDDGSGYDTFAVSENTADHLICYIIENIHWDNDENPEVPDLQERFDKWCIENKQSLTK